MIDMREGAPSAFACKLSTRFQIFTETGMRCYTNQVPPCTGNNAHTNTRYAATSLIIMKYS